MCNDQQRHVDQKSAKQKRSLRAAHAHASCHNRKQQSAGAEHPPVVALENLGRDGQGIYQGGESSDAEHVENVGADDVAHRDVILTAAIKAVIAPSQAPRFVDFAGFVQHLREAGLPPAVISPRRFCSALNIELQTVAELAHVHRNTVQRAPASAPVQTYLRAALGVIRAASEQLGDIEAALFWFRNEPLPEFDFQTPAQVMSSQGPGPLLQCLRAAGG